jgi:hypothetical protein
MSDLPPLPEPDTHCWDDDSLCDVWSYSADQMHAYAAAALAAERERCAKLCDDVARSAYELDGRHSSAHTEGKGDGAAECAALIRSSPK